MQKNSSWPVWLALVLIVTFSSICTAQVQGGESEDSQWFSVDTLNAGLGEIPDEVKRRTPRESVRSFVELTKDEDYAAAAHLLNLSDLSLGEQAEQGSELARQLAEIFKRGEWLNVSNLSGRQDAAIEDSSGQNPQAGMPRRDIEITSLQAGGEAYDIRLGRYQVEGEDPVWLIMPESVSSIPVLYEEYGPSDRKSVV